MTLLHRLASIVRWLVRRNRAEQDLHDEVQAFVDAVINKQAPTPGPDDALASLRVALAATRSLQERRTVKLEEVKP